MRDQKRSTAIRLSSRRLAPARLDADYELAGARQLCDDAFSGRSRLARRVEHPSAACLGGFFFVCKRKLSALFELGGVILIAAVFAPITFENDLWFVVGFLAGNQQPEIGQSLADVQAQLQAVTFAVTAKEFKEGRVFFNGVDANRLTFSHRLHVELLVWLDGGRLIDNREFQIFVGRRLTDYGERVVGGALLFSAGGSGHGLSSSLQFLLSNPF